MLHVAIAVVPLIRLIEADAEPGLPLGRAQ